MLSGIRRLTSGPAHVQTLKHPNIVRLYDVIETDKYIGIILEYASGGELFDHILAHRYLREKDACKLFCQLISGVWYIHQKKIVHRDLKLENLLLDRHRNVIITDFGFANRFEHRSDDLMQTSCGSPCYAAPELVISDGAYVGSAVDVWSCGVILYAMLAGYLPFDDDPANPDGDNINLLYKYIVNTPLSFPDYISPEARDLLSIMLVPDPEHRATLQAVMDHGWLAPYAHLFDRTVDELEDAAMEQHRQKRLAYQKQMRQAAAESSPTTNKISRTQSAAIPNAQHSSRNRAQPEYLYETSGDQSMYSTGSPASARRGYTSVVVPPTSAPMGLEDDPFAPSPSQEVPSISIPSPSGDGVQEEPRTRKTSRASERKAPPSAMPANISPESKRQKSGFRHTIQVEVGESEQEQQPAHQAAHPPAEQQEKPVSGASPRRSSSARAPVAAASAPERRSSKRTAASSEHISAKPLPTTPTATPAKASAAVEEPVIQVTSPPTSPPQESKSAHAQAATGSSSGSVSSRGKHTRGISMDKIGKMFGSSTETPEKNGSMSRTPSQKSSPGQASSPEAASPAGSLGAKRPTTLQPLSPAPSHVQPTDPALLSPETPSSTKKSRRNTLTSIMTEQFKLSLKQRSKGKASPAESPVRSQEKVAAPPIEEVKAPEPVSVPETPAKPPVPPKETAPPATPRFNPARPDVSAVPASTVKANKVMQWFRLKSKGKAPTDVGSDAEQPVMVERPTNMSTTNPAAASTSTVSHSAALEKAVPPPPTPGHASRGPSSVADASFSEKTFPAVWSRGNTKGTIRVHHGAVDPTMFTTGYPLDVMQQVKKVLEEMGVEIQIEGEYKYRCVRPKRRKAAAGTGLGLRDTGSGLAAFTMAGTAASNGVRFLSCVYGYMSTDRSNAGRQARAACTIAVSRFVRISHDWDAEGLDDAQAVVADVDCPRPRC